MGSDQDLQLLQGAWDIITLEVDGNSVPKMFFSGSQIVIDGSRFSTKAMGAIYEGMVIVDADSNPKRLTIAFDKGPEKGNTSYAIYELKGDSWRLCMTTRGGSFPLEFGTSAGTGLALETLTRATTKATQNPKLEKSDQSEPEVAQKSHSKQSDSGPDTGLDGKWTMVAGILDGHKLEKSMLNCGIRDCSAEDVTVSFGGQIFLKARYTVNSKITPMQIDYQLPNGTRQLGIYKIERGVVTFCMAAAGNDRPSDFETKPGDGRTFSSWIKAK